MKKKVIFLCGDPNEKRRLMRRDHPIAYADNDEVSVAVRIDGTDYYVVGTHPFGDFSVHQYLSYSYSLIGRKPLSKIAAKEMLLRVGLRIGLNVRMGALDMIRRRLVCLAPKLNEDTTSVALNFDGMMYSGFKRFCLKRRLGKLALRYNVTASVSDYRFSGEDGIMVKLGTLYSSELYDKKTKLVKKRRFTNLLSSLDYPVPPLERSDIVRVK